MKDHALLKTEIVILFFLLTYLQNVSLIIVCSSLFILRNFFSGEHRPLVDMHLTLSDFVWQLQHEAEFGLPVGIHLGQPGLGESLHKEKGRSVSYCEIQRLVILIFSQRIFINLPSIINQEIYYEYKSNLWLYFVIRLFSIGYLI